LAFGLAVFGCAGWLGPASTDDSAAGEGIDAGARPAQIGDDGHATAARRSRNVDAVGRADAAHDVAFGVQQRDRAAVGGGAPAALSASALADGAMPGQRRRR
jgi:hypothetical protein